MEESWKHYHHQGKPVDRTGAGELSHQARAAGAHNSPLADVQSSRLRRFAGNMHAIVGPCSVLDAVNSGHGTIMQALNTPGGKNTFGSGLWH